MNSLKKYLRAQITKRRKFIIYINVNAVSKNIPQKIRIEKIRN